jgi:hypothetical protein
MTRSFSCDRSANNNCIPAHGGPMPNGRQAGVMTKQSSPDLDVLTSVLVDRHMSSQADLAASPSTRPGSMPASTTSEQYSTLTELKPVNAPVHSGGYATRDVAYLPVSPYDGKSIGEHHCKRQCNVRSFD